MSVLLIVSMFVQMELFCTIKRNVLVVDTACMPVHLVRHNSQDKVSLAQKAQPDKCTFCAGGPEETHSEKENKLYGQNRIAEGKVPACAAMCSTKALLAGDATSVSKLSLSVF